MGRKSKASRPSPSFVRWILQDKCLNICQVNDFDADDIDRFDIDRFDIDRLVSRFIRNVSNSHD